MNRPIRTRTAAVLRAATSVIAAVAAATWMLIAVCILPALWRDQRSRDERGQSTVEYALILLGAAAIALVVVAWVTRTDAIGRLFDTVIGRVLQQAD